MDIKKSKQFFESVIYNSAKMTGDTTAIMPIIQKFCNELGITESLEVIAENNKHLQEKELETEREKAVANIASLAAGYEKADKSERQNIIDSIQRENITLNKTVTTEQKIITSKALMLTQYPPRKWIVENLIGSGLTILSGSSKIGKSWLLFALAEAASTGGKFLDHYTVNKTSVLHLSLEDEERDIKERREMLAQKQAESYAGNDSLSIATEWKDGLDGLNTYLRAHSEIKFVIIDTLGTFMPEIENMNDYAPTVKALTRIKKIADGLDIAILVVHHAKKGSSQEKGDWMDQSLGSQGIVATADTIILLQRDIGDQTREKTGKLYATGRRIKDTFHKVEYSPSFGMWEITDKDNKPKSPGTSNTTQPAEDKPRYGL